VQLIDRVQRTMYGCSALKREQYECSDNWLLNIQAAKLIPKG
jgi:hypothetical protein